jgi:hypothetical protein
MKDIAVKFNFKWFSGFRVEDKMDDNYTTEIKRPSGQINYKYLHLSFINGSTSQTK